jgi:histidine ammonia-lyase
LAYFAKKLMKAFHYGEDHLTVANALALSEGRLKGIISASAKFRIEQCEQTVSQIVASGQTVYGINTGFGPLCNTSISAEQSSQLQINLLVSHSVGVGQPVPLSVVALMLVLKLQALCKGYSGISLQTVERILWHLEQKILPFVPEQGSVGASGDLAPLSHLFLPLIGMGKLFYQGSYRNSSEVLALEGMQPLSLGAKEGLALINGTQFIAAYGLMGVSKLHNLLECADLVGAMSLEAMQGSAAPSDEELHNLRPFAGTQYVAYRLRTLLAGSAIMEAHRYCSRVQDPYSLRCMPQVHGASRNAWLHIKEMLEIEINSVTDNPLVFSVEKTVSGGNFHGQPVAMPMDYMALATSELGSISERRAYLILEGKYEGLPKLLVSSTGLNSGFMIPQYTAAALASENKSLCFPASADSIPTSLGQEDHVSMGSIAARKALKICQNTEYILGIELMMAAQGLEFRRPLASTPIIEAMHALVREHIDFLTQDRFMADDIEKAKSLIESGKLLYCANQTAFDLGIDLAGHWKNVFC